MKEKILYAMMVLASGVFVTSCSTTVPFAFTNTFYISSDHVREIVEGPWEVINKTQFRVIMDHNEKIIFIIGRDSILVDYKDNFNFFVTKPDDDWFPGIDERIKIHSGFYKRYKSVRNALLETAYKYPDYSIYVSGYSLGGTWTQLFLLDAILLWPDRDIRAIFYAAANPWRKLPEKYRKELEQRTIFIKTYWDPVTWMSVIGFYRYGHNITVGKWWRIFPPQHGPPQMIRALDELF